jgi:hypothetical protein
MRTRHVGKAPDLAETLRSSIAIPCSYIRVHRAELQSLAPHESFMARNVG